MQLFLDANVIFSAAYLASHESRARAIFRLSEAGYGELISSRYAIDEARRNITKRYPERISELTQLLSQIVICPEPPQDIVAWAITTLSMPMKDAPILAAAIAAEVDWLVTGDQSDFGHLYGKVIRGVEVLTPAAALKKLIGKHG